MRSTEPDQPADPSEFPPELQEALRRMSQRGPVRDLTTGDDGGQIIPPLAHEELRAAVARTAALRTGRPAP